MLGLFLPFKYFNNGDFHVKLLLNMKTQSFFAMTLMRHKLNFIPV